MLQMNDDAIKIVRRFFLIMQRKEKRHTHLADTFAQLSILYTDVKNMFHTTDLFPNANDSERPMGE